MGTNRYKPFSTYIMQGDFTLLLSATVSTVETVKAVQLLINQSRVTFEADNNLDFRLGTGALRNTKIASKDDLALITRKSEFDYELRIIKQTDVRYLHSSLHCSCWSFNACCAFVPMPLSCSRLWISRCIRLGLIFRSMATSVWIGGLNFNLCQFFSRKS